MAKRRYSVVVDIGSRCLKIVIFDINIDRLFLSIVKDLSSLETEEDKQKYIIKTLREVIHTDILRSATVRLSLSDKSVQFKRLELPRMPNEEIPEALKWRMKGLVPFDVESAVLDYDIIDEVTDEEGAKNFVVMMAIAQREIIDRRISLLKEAGIETISGVNVDSFGLSSVIKLMPEEKKESVPAILSVNNIGSVVNIYREGKLVFVRSIPIGIDTIKSSIKGSIATDQGMLEPTPHQIEMLRDIGIPQNRDVILEGRLEGRHILAFLRPVLENLCTEIVRSIDYYTVQLEGKKVSRLYLIGQGVNYKGLDTFIKERINIETVHLKLPQSLLGDTTKDISKTKEIASEMLPLIGVARGGSDIKVNLLPLDYRVEKVQKIQKIFIRMSAFFVFTLFLVSFIFVNTQLRDYKQRLQNAKRHINILKEIKILYSKVAQREKFLRVVKKQELPTIYILKELSNLVPEDIMLKTLIVNQREKVLTLSGIIHKGDEIDELVLTRFMESLEKSRFFRDIRLESSEKGFVDGEEITSFNINCIIEK